MIDDDDDEVAHSEKLKYRTGKFLFAIFFIVVAIIMWALGLFDIQT